MKRTLLIAVGILCLIIGARLILSRDFNLNINEALPSKVVSNTDQTQINTTAMEIESTTEGISASSFDASEGQSNSINTELESTNDFVMQTADEQTSQSSEEQSKTQSEPSQIERKIAVNNDTTAAGNYVKDSYINQQINENIDNIDQGDLDAGAAIYNRLDTDYIFSLADGGLTDEERAELNEYMNSQLTPAEYDLVKNLYFKYVGLLNDD